MYAKGMSTRDFAVVIAFNAESTARFLTRDNKEMDEFVLDTASQQIKTRQAYLPKEGDTMIICISLTDTESSKVLNEDADFESHFLEIVTQQVENTQKDIDRFEKQKAAGYVPSRRERKQTVPV